MQQPIMTSVAFLSQASAPADPSNDEDRATATDLRDTLAAHRGECVGMAANMIGVAKRIIVFQDKENNRNAIMFNPRIIAGSDPFDTAEGCLSLDGERPTTRYQSITVTYRARIHDCLRRIHRANHPTRNRSRQRHHHLTNNDGHRVISPKSTM